MTYKLDRDGKRLSQGVEDKDPHSDTQTVSGWGFYQKSSTKGELQEKCISVRVAQCAHRPARSLMMESVSEPALATLAHPLAVTLQDVIAAVERSDLDYAESTKARVLSALRAAIHRMYDNEDPSRIIVTLDAFERKWGRGRVRRIPPGYADLGPKAFMQARSYIRGAIMRYTGEAERRAELRARNDDWRTLRDQLVEAAEKGLVHFREKLVIAFDVLTHIARTDNRQPSEIDIAWFERALKDVPTAPRRRSLREAAQLIDDLRLRPDLFPADLLPPEPIAEARYTPPRRNCRPRPPSLVTPLTEWIAKKGGGGEPKGAKRRSGKPVKPNTLKVLTRGAEWYIDSLYELCLIDPGSSPTPAEIAREDWIRRCVEAEVRGELPWKELSANSLFGYMKSAILWLQQYSSDFRTLTSEIRNDHEFLNGVGLMTEDHQKWCKAFVRDKRKIMTFFDMPKTLQAKADAALANYDSLNQARRAQAINLAIAAAMAAILVNLPLRSSSLEALTVGGQMAHVRLPGSDPDLLRIVLPPQFVKNNVEINQPIQRKGPVSAREVIDWFIGRPRALLMQNHMRQDPDATRLFCGIGYNRLDDSWQFGTTAVGLPMTQHLSRHAIASFLINRDEKYLPLAAALLGITVERARKSYAFVDKGRRAREADDVLAAELAILRSDHDDHGLADNDPDKGGRR